METSKHLHFRTSEVRKKKEKKKTLTIVEVVYLALGRGLAAHCDLLQVVKMAEVFGWRE